MSRTSLKNRLTQGLLLLDGAMGTKLIARGTEVGKCNDYLNVESPDVVMDIHRAYLQAGSDAVLTNTFGANKYVLARHGLADDVEKINKAGAQIARRAAREISNLESRILDHMSWVTSDRVASSWSLWVTCSRSS